MIQLTLAYDPGSLDPGQSYTHVKILHVGQRYYPERRTTIRWAYGYLDAGVWVMGKAGKCDRTFSATEFGTYLSEILSTEDETADDAWYRALHQSLINVGDLEGTVVDP